MAGYKRCIISFSFLFISIFFLSFGALSMNRRVIAHAGTGKADSMSFETKGEEPVIRFGEEKLSAYFGREEGELTIDGTEEIPLIEFLKGEKLSIIFHLKVPSGNSSKTLEEKEPCKVDLELSKYPVYWRLVTEKEVLGVGNYEVKSPEKFRELLPKAINGVEAEYQVLRAEKASQEILLEMGRKENCKEGKVLEDKLKLSSLPPELRLKDFGKKKGETVGKLELMADYSFRLPLLRTEEKGQYTPAIQGKLTLVIWREVYYD
ncbi:hypothetical protein [Anaerocolumna xylanovorans]|uniref:Uncharacterized protein n=1 Tax=Anaerocolumna xylanovorans DSM 12503 TaxID=1121345 RepID=A0A1M7Y9Y0_9FIRM|nr:hypothetical protein [Anaerocolumna xylanovorans]SHO49417.1 hypothetical protein SAMN02745217_02298 [Anaerocolumna xylanovorans DSM 12503]